MEKTRKVKLSLVAVNFIIWTLYVLVFSAILDLTVTHSAAFIIFIEGIQFYLGFCMYYAEEVEKQIEKKNVTADQFRKDWWTILVAPFYMLYTIPRVYMMLFLFGIINEVIIVIVVIVPMDKTMFDWLMFVLELDIVAIMYSLNKIYFYGSRAHEVEDSRLTPFYVLISSYSFVYDSHLKFRNWFISWAEEKDHAREPVLPLYHNFD